MQKERINYVILLVGKRACGKTSVGLKLALASGKNILVINTDNNEAYKQFEMVPLENLQNWRGSKGMVVTSNPIQAMTIANGYLKNLFIILDDTQKYVSQSVQQEVKNFIINHRMRNFDVVLMYHSLKFVPPYFANQFNKLLLFKTQDSNMGDLKNRYVNYEKIAHDLPIIRNHKSPYFFTIIKDT